MFSVGIIGDIHDWHTEKINFFLKKNNCNVFTLKFSDLQIKFSKKNFYLYNKAIKLNLDGVWVRFIGNGTFEEITTKLTLLHLLENTKTYVHNSPRIIEKTVDKVRTSGILEINKIDSPETIIWHGKSLNKKLINTSQIFFNIVEACS